ncbi:MAG: acyl-CoA dehydrogenase family protein [Chloroflexi bacterium]|nr:acyl-CoA dehydrogenase family protein [Chloroflexota bacterium]
MPPSEQQELLRATAKDYAERELAPNAASVDEREEFPEDAFRGLASLGLCGLTISEEAGGAGGGYVDIATVIEEIAVVCGSSSTAYITHVSLGTAAIARFANAEQLQRLVPPLSSGEKIAAFALTEPGTGSDALGMATTAKRDGDDYILNGSKTFITNGTHADTFVVFANSDRDAGYKGINALVVERGTEGFSTNHLTGKMGMRGSGTAELVFDDCRIPASNRLGDDGAGYSVALSTLTTSRVSIAAQCIGLARGAYEAALSYSKQRKTFGKPISEHQAIAFMLADMATEIDAARLLTHRAAEIIDSGGHPVKESAMAKLYASEVLGRVATKAVQIHGGTGYFKPSIVERIFRDAKVTEIYEGTSEIQRLIISRSILS